MQFPFLYNSRPRLTEALFMFSYEMSRPTLTAINDLWNMFLMAYLYGNLLFKELLLFFCSILEKVNFKA